MGQALKSSHKRQLKSQHEDKETPKSASRRSARTLRPTKISELTLSGTGSERQEGTHAGRATQGERTKTGSCSLNNTYSDNKERIKEQGILAQELSSHPHIASINMSSTPNDNVIDLPLGSVVNTHLELKTLEAFMRREAEEPTLVIRTPNHLADTDPNPAPITEDTLNDALNRFTLAYRLAGDNAVRVSLGGEIPLSDEDELTGEEENNNGSPEQSRAATPVAHPGYPYQERLSPDVDDLPQSNGPYQAVRVNPVTGEPRLLTKEDCDAAAYDEGPVHAQPIGDHGGFPEELDHEGRRYPFDENSMMDIQFLAALGIVADRGLAAENLRLVQAEGEQRALDRWEKRLKAQEEFTLAERRKFHEAKNDLAKKRGDAHRRLQKAKAGGRLGEQLGDMPHRSGLPPRAQGQPYPGPLLALKKEPRRCYWCSQDAPLRGSLTGHRAKYCPTPHRPGVLVRNL
jgi:hypothetical protein